jgi:sugar fermentation stimulation protein A
MLFPTPLIPARLRRRYKRFLADVILPDGSEAIVHCPNPGSMLGLAAPETICWLSDQRGTSRKLPFGWEVAELDGRHLVGINTGLANAIVAEALAAGRIPPLAGYDEIRREVKVGSQSRLDFQLLNHAAGTSAGSCFVEVKSVTLGRTEGLAEFPDARTTRGARHLVELAELAATGHRAMLLFLVQRDDCKRVRCAADIDPVYAAGLRQVAGTVEIRAFACDFNLEDDRPTGITLGHEIPVDVT